MQPKELLSKKKKNKSHLKCWFIGFLKGDTNLTKEVNCTIVSTPWTLHVTHTKQMQGGQNVVEVTLTLTVIYTRWKGKVVLIQCSYLSFFLSACIIEHSGVPLSALDSKQIKNLIWLSRTLVNVMEGYFANEIVQ